MKTILKLSAISVILIIASCNKDIGGIHSMGTPSGGYSSMQDFYNHNGVPLQLYTVDAVAGGTFTTPHGTIVTIPANAFVTMSNQPVTGSVVIEFKDIYTKSEMLLSNKPSMLYSGAPLKSGGEFYIKALSQNQPLQLATGNQINVIQPTGNAPVDSMMLAFGGDRTAWQLWQNNAAVVAASSSYVFSLYQFQMPADSGSWCNSDNAGYFSAYTQGQLTLHPNDDPFNFQTDVFLVFQNLNSMVHVYKSGSDFPYAYAPIGLQCTVVAVGVKDGKLYSSFTPITISANMTVNFSLSEITTDDFKRQLNALN